MPETADRLQPHVASFLALRENLVRILGETTVDVIIDRATVEIRQVYPELALIRVSNEGVDTDALAAAMEPKSDEQVRAAFDALNGVVMLILARLLGKEVAARFAPDDGRGGRPYGAK